MAKWLQEPEYQRMSALRLAGEREMSTKKYDDEARCFEKKEKSSKLCFVCVVTTIRCRQHIPTCMLKGNVIWCSNIRRISSTPFTCRWGKYIETLSCTSKAKGTKLTQTKTEHRRESYTWDTCYHYCIEIIIQHSTPPSKDFGVTIQFFLFFLILFFFSSLKNWRADYIAFITKT